MQRTEKEQVVAELAEQLRSTDSLIIADYRGLTNTQLEELRGKLRSSGARFQVVKNTLTRRAASEAGAGALLAPLAGPAASALGGPGRGPPPPAARRCPTRERLRGRGRPPRRRRQGAVRHREGDEGPRAPRRDALRPVDV